MLDKYSDIRAFAYTHIESFIKQQNKRKNNNIQNNNLHVYKQMIERERKHWTFELNRKEQQIDKMQEIMKTQEEELN